MNQKFLAEFSSPPSQYRGAPFWAWNGELQPDELRRQIRLMHRMGLGGFFMHSRVGLATDYMSKQWMDCIDACVDEAEKLDMQAWLYDEDRWPSGAAGGIVTKNPRYRQRRLHMTVVDKPADLKWTPDTLAAFVAVVKDGQASDVKRIARGRKPARLAAGQRILAFERRIQGCTSWYNGYTYLDTLSHEAVREFIRVTHKAYEKRFGKELGKRIPGIFTDEPNHGGHGGDVFTATGSGQCPWTDKLPQVFRKRYGYDILNHLVEIFYVVDGRQVSKARWDFHDCLTHLFVDAFARQIGQWCDKTNCLHTGHVLLEGGLSSQTNVVGSCMRFYEYMQAPGMDILTEYWREYDTAKQVSSAAHQFDRRWRLTETYGCTGWDFPFAGHKAVGDWQAALGINLRCQHLAWYTMEGEAKRDYPAGIFYQSPWWELYPKVEDYFGRVHVAMSRGKEVRDLLVVHPVESTWSVFCKGAEAAQKAQQDTFWRLRDCLLGANLDFDYGDEEILSRHARVRGGDAPTLTVGKAAYRAVIVPEMLTLRSSTVDILKRFQKAGGAVIFAGKPADHVDALPSGDVAALAASCVRTAKRGPALVKAAEKVGRRVSITDGKGREIIQTLYCLREDADSFYLFVCNTSEPNISRKEVDTGVRNRTLAFDDVRIRLYADGAGQATELDCEVGRTYAADGRREADGWSVRTSLPALGSRLFVFDKKKSGKSLSPRPKMKDVRSQTLGGKSPWTVSLTEPNVVVLDRPRYRIAGGKWQKPTEILFVDRAVRESLGLAHRGGQMVQPWARPKPANPKRTTVELEYEFDAKALPTGALWLAVERPNTFKVSLNDYQADTDVAAGWWVDRSLIKIPLDTAAVKLGRNVVRLVCDYSELHPGLEIAYLLGTFGAEARGADITMTRAPAALRLGDWVRQGLAFYSGSVCYTQTVRPKLVRGQRLFVHVPGYAGAAVRVLVDGKSAGVVGWQPNEVEITSLVADAKQPVTLTVEIMGHRRNSHGPLHLKDPHPTWTGPGQYVDVKNWADAYQLVPCGLTKPPRLVTRK